MSRPITPLPTIITSSPPRAPPILTSPPRSTTLPAKQKPHHIPHAPHRSHHQHRRDKSVPQSAVQTLSSNPFGDFMSKTATGSKDFLAKTTTSKGDGTAGGAKTPPQPLPAEELAREERERDAAEKERRKWGQVERMRVRRLEGEEHLRQTLTTLSALSNTTTRRLDYTYYALLSSLSHLSSSIHSLHTLATSTNTLHQNFTTEIATTAAEITTMTGIGEESMQRQTQRIEMLGARMRDGRARVRELGERLGRVRERIEECERRDEGGGGRGWMWGMGGAVGVIAVVVLGVVVRGGGERGVERMGGGERGVGGVGEVMGNWSVEGSGGWDDRGESVREVREGGVVSETREGGRLEDMATGKTSSKVDAEAILRLFDEL